MIQSFIQQLQHFRDRRLVAIFLFGIASGFPWVMIGSAMAAWLAESGFSRTAIGFFGSVFLAYSINFFWSPLLDRIRLPYLGQRRGWIATMQYALVLCCVVISQVDLQNQLYLAGLTAFILALCSATQDIAIDAYRIDVIQSHEREKLSAASSLATAGWWTGYGGLGAIPFFVVDMQGWNWSKIYLLLAAMMALLSLTVWLVKEPETDRQKQQAKAQAEYQTMLFQRSQGISAQLSSWLLVTVVEPFREFFNRNGVRLALSVLLFLFLFKIGEAFLGRMSIVFYKELGFSNGDIGTFSKLLNWWIVIVFSIVGGLVNMRYGIYRGLMIGGIAMAASNLMFAVMAQAGPDKTLFAITVIVDGFTTAWSSVALVAFISLLCSRSFSATQYALMASLGTLGRTLLASSSGLLVDWMQGNWTLFFILTALMVLPSLVFLWLIRDRVTQLEKQVTSSQ